MLFFHRLFTDETFVKQMEVSHALEKLTNLPRPPLVLTSINRRLVDDKKKTKKGRALSFFGKKSKDFKDDEKMKDLKDEKKKKSHLRKQRSTTKSLVAAAAHGGTNE
uniref:Uncharacterized protein n=1 Tax=Panagrolaimus davidi TaxID=227884 RepID=A0A914PCV3_9BILA